MTSVVTNPQAGDVHVNVPLTNFAQKFIQDADAFVASRAFPNSPVAKQSDLYYEFDRDDFMRDDAEERADGTESAGGGFDLSTNPYFAKVYAFHKDVTDRQRSNQDSVIRLDQSASQFVTQKLLIRREVLFAATYMATGLWTTDWTGVAATPSSVQFLTWDLATSDPIADIRAAKAVIHGSTGFRPNKMIMGRATYDVLLDNDAILDRISGGATTSLPAQVMKQKLTELLELEEIFVMDGVQTTSQKGATAVRAFIGADDALLYYAPNTASLEEPTAGVQFSWTGLLGNSPSGTRIKRFRMEHLEADRLEGQMAFDYRLTAADLGLFFTNTVG